MCFDAIEGSESDLACCSPPCLDRSFVNVRSVRSNDALISCLGRISFVSTIVCYSSMTRKVPGYLRRIFRRQQLPNGRVVTCRYDFLVRLRGRFLDLFVVV